MEATSLAPLAPRPGDQYRLLNLCNSMRTVMTRRSKMSSAISTTDSTDEPNHRLHWLPRLDRRVTICQEKEAQPPSYQASSLCTRGPPGPPHHAGAAPTYHPTQKNGHETSRNRGASQGPSPSCVSHRHPSHTQTSHPSSLLQCVHFILDPTSFSLSSTPGTQTLLAPQR